MSKSTAETNQEIAYHLSNNLIRLLHEFGRDFQTRVLKRVHELGHSNIRPSHSSVFSNLGMGAVRVTELAERAQVTQQAMGKMLKELERMGYISRDVDAQDKRAREIRLTPSGISLVEDSLKAVTEVRAFYAEKVGTEELQELENRLRTAVKKIELNYLPESWVDAG